MMIYVVKGYTGMYDDFSEWIVCACTSEKVADKRASELESLIKELGLDCDIRDFGIFNKLRDEMTKHPNGDPGFCMQRNTDTGYYTEETELIDD